MDTRPVAAPRRWQPIAARADGFAFATFAEVLIKSLLEAETEFSAMFLPRGDFARSLFQAVVHEEAVAALTLNRMRLEDGVDGPRAVTLLTEECLACRHGAVYLSNDSLNLSFAALKRLVLAFSRNESMGRAVLLLEDDPTGSPNTCPRRVSRRLRLPMVEPCDLASLPRTISSAASLSHLTRLPCVVVLHRTLRQSCATIEMHANRLVSTEDQVSWLMDRRRPRAAETGDALAFIRRLEINRHVSLPSPGEREPLAFICVGVSTVAVLNMLSNLGLGGRVPVLRLEAISPVDEAVVQRLLERCDHVIVVEPRPGSVAPRIVGIAQAARRQSRHAGQVWWDELPPTGDNIRRGLSGLETISGSMLARQLEPLLRAWRPTPELDTRLQPLSSVQQIALPPRGEALTAAHACREVSALLRSTTVVSDDGTRALTLGFAVDGEVTEGIAEPMIAEVWDGERFLAEGLSACRHIATTSQSRMLVVVDLPSELGRPIVELVKTVASLAPSLLVELEDLNDRAALRARATSALLREESTILVIRDGPPSRRDPVAMRAAAAEIDRLGHAPLERLIWPAWTACELRPSEFDRLVAEGLERGEQGLARETTTMRSPDGPLAWFVKVEPMLEQIEVRRLRAPTAYAWSSGSRLAPPRPIHGAQGSWRAHLAGIRGDAPGIAGRLLAEAGRAMGYSVETMHDETPTGPGRSAWTQLLWTRAGSTLDAPVSAMIPFGEADLIVGLEPDEGLRALGADPTLRVPNPDHTCIVANTGWLSDARDRSDEIPKALRQALSGWPDAGRIRLANFAQRARRAMLSDRMLDVVLLGVAFQNGWIPVTQAALEAAARRLEQRQVARCLEALHLGRQLASEREDDALSTTMSTPAERVARRAIHDVRRRGRVRRRDARLFEVLLSQALEMTSGLEATAAGAIARGELIESLYRAVLFGGVSYAERLIDLVAGLKMTDDGSRHWPVTTAAILPLCEIFLPHDVFAVAAMANSPLHRRRIRDLLDVRMALGDELDRRFLIRVDTAFAHRRWRIEFRASDWPLQLLEAIRPFVPLRFRATEAQVQLRKRIVEIVAQAAHDPAGTERWVAFAEALSEHVTNGTIRSLTPKDLDQLLAQHSAQ